MLVDPLPVKEADAITSTLANLNFARIAMNRDMNEYVSVFESATLVVTQTLRVGNYANGSATQRRVVVSLKKETWNKTDQEFLLPYTVTFSVFFDTRNPDEAGVTQSLRRLVFLLTNTTDGGLLARIQDGEK